MCIRDSSNYGDTSEINEKCTTTRSRPLYCSLAFGRGRTHAFGVYIGHKICHRVPATTATLLSRPAITMSEGPKDQKSRCSASKQVISCPVALKQQFLVFLRPQCQSNLKYRQKIELSQFFEDNTCAHLATAICSKF